MRKFLCFVLSLSLCLSLLTGCGSQADGKPRKKAVRREPAETVSAQLAGPESGDLIAVFDTSYGEIRAVLYPEAAPMAVENFTGLAEQGYYDGTLFHRVIYGFVTQGGDASGTGQKGATIWNNNPFPAEISAELRHYSGALCAANSPEEEASTTSQFYFVQSLPGELDPDLRAKLEAAGTDASVLADLQLVHYPLLQRG